jgi:polysaccharide biosynthesis/export protein
MSFAVTRHASVFLAAVTFTAGCSTMPAFGPNAETITRVGTQGDISIPNALPFEVINITATTLPPAIHATALFPATLRAQQFLSTDETIGLGDLLDIRIWEMAEDGLFATAGNRETTLNVQVSNSGQITVPYAGAVDAGGLTTTQLRSLLLERYQGRAVEPEIAVSIAGTEGRSATLLGDVRNPGRVTIPPRGIRLLDLIAESGGTEFAPWETLISVQRKSTSGTLTLADVISSQANNIVILPGDIVNVVHQPRRFAVYGGVSRPSNIEIPTADANLAYLLAEVGGLNDRVAQARSVFVFRQTANSGAAVAYQLDFSRPDALLLAGAFQLRPADITYVASADAADFQRFVSIILSPLLGTARGITTFRD